MIKISATSAINIRYNTITYMSITDYIHYMWNLFIVVTIGLTSVAVMEGGGCFVDVH